MAIHLDELVTLSNDLTLVNQQLRAAFNRISKAYQLNITQCAIMQKMADITPADGRLSLLTLSDALGMSNAMVSRQITTLTTQGLVTETADRRDRRQRIVELTPSGTKLLTELATVFDESDDFNKEPVHRAVLAHIVEIISLLNELSVL